MNWIKAENPPKDMHEVLITVKNKVTLGHYNYSKNEWFGHTDYEQVNVSHWMEKPLPPPCRATWEQLAYWLVDGKGLILDTETNRVDTGVIFDKKNMQEEVGERWLVMARGDTEWHEPTVQIAKMNGYISHLEEVLEHHGIILPKGHEFVMNNPPLPSAPKEEI